MALVGSLEILEAGVLSVRGTLGRVGGKLVITEPKTAGSRRTVPLPAPLVAMLRAHRADQEAERAAARDMWTDHNLVFATELGTPVERTSNLRGFENCPEPIRLARRLI